MGLLAHENLIVYDKSLNFFALADEMLSTWDAKHTVKDQLARASESIVVNLAEGVGLRSNENRILRFEYAAGSALECAACLDVGNAKALLTRDETIHGKQLLQEIVRMLVGLRKATIAHFREEPTLTPTLDENQPVLFPHEQLNVYAEAIHFVRWICLLDQKSNLPAELFRQIDKASTAIPLNIAEGNGRYSSTDHSRFINQAKQAAVKAAAYLDLMAIRQIRPPDEILRGKQSLRQIIPMLVGLVKYAEGE